MKKISYGLTLALITVFLGGKVYSAGSTAKISNFTLKAVAAGTVVEEDLSDEAEEVDVIKRSSGTKTDKELKAEEKKRKAEMEAALKAEKAAAKKKADAEKKAAEKEDAAAKKEAAKLAAAEKKAQKKAAAEEKAAAKAALIAEKNKNFAGWDVEAETKPFEIVSGIMRFKVDPRSGTFNMALIDPDGKAYPVFATTNEYTSTSFYLRKNERIIKLSEDLNVKTTTRKTETGFQIAYKVDEVAFVLLDFECFNTVVAAPEDTVRIKATVKSISKKSANFDLKIVMDTVLGEIDRHHFYYSDGNPVKNEVGIRNMNDAPWILSKNNHGSLQVLLQGYDITTPSLVALGNYATLDTKYWEPNLMSTRAFDTVLSYNNSAIGILWPRHKMTLNQSYSEVFYLSVSNTSKNPTGALFIKTNKDNLPIEEPEDEIPDENYEVAARQPKQKKPKAVEVPVEETPAAETPVVEQPKPVEVQQPVEEPKPVEVIKPVEEPKPAPVVEPVKEEPKEEPKPAPKKDEEKYVPQLEEEPEVKVSGIGSGATPVAGKRNAATNKPSVLDKAKAAKKAKEEAEQAKKDAAKQVKDPVVETKPVKEEPKKQEPVVEEKPKEEPKKVEPKVEPKKETPKVEEPKKTEPKTVTKEQLSPEYIQKLLKRIAELETSGEEIDRDELIQLNAELDVILEFLQK